MKLHGLDSNIKFLNSNTLWDSHNNDRERNCECVNLHGDQFVSVLTSNSPNTARAILVLWEHIWEKITTHEYEDKKLVDE